MSFLPSNIIWYWLVDGDAVSLVRMNLGLASRWPRVADLTYPPVGSRPKRKVSAPTGHIQSLASFALFYFE